MVYCVASVFIVLLHAHFFIHNVSVESSFHFIVLVIVFLPALIHLSTCQTLLLQPMVATSYLFTPGLIVAYFSYGHYFSLLCIGHSFIILFLLYRSLLLTWVETITSLSTAYDRVDRISLKVVIFFDVY